MSITVHPRTWDHLGDAFFADTNRIGGMPAKTFKIKCPKFMGSAAPKTGRRDIGATAVIVGKDDEPIETAMMAPPDPHFKRLQYLFWKYLRWQERLTVLASLRLLPPGDSRVPEAVEREALDLAREKGSLKSLWDAVMQHVPSEKREKNPY